MKERGSWLSAKLGRDSAIEIGHRENVLTGFSRNPESIVARLKLARFRIDAPPH